MSFDLKRSLENVRHMLASDGTILDNGRTLYRDLLTVSANNNANTETLFSIEIASRICHIHDGMAINVLGNSTYYKMADMKYDKPSYYRDNYEILGIPVDDDGKPIIIEWHDQHSFNSICSRKIFGANGIIQLMVNHASGTDTTFSDQLQRLQHHLETSDLVTVPNTERLFLLEKEVDDATLTGKDYNTDEQKKDDHVKSSDEIRFTFTSVDTLKLLINKSTKKELLNAMMKYRS